MKRLVLRTLLFFSPLLIPIALYVVIDPFGVLYSENYRNSANRDFQSMEIFLSNHPNNHYNSFIFGNSRSIYYETASWQQFIEGNPFHFDASAESIYGINGKLEFLNENSIPIKNALIVLDVSTIAKTENSAGHLYVKHPKISKDNKVKFQIEMFLDFLPVSVFAYSDFYFFKKPRPYMTKYIVCDTISRLEVKTNELTYDEYEQQIKTNPALYYDASRIKLFYKRKPVVPDSKPCIAFPQQKVLENIRSILVAHQTHYRIVISPLYDQKRINRADLKYLQQLFGKATVFDFSGKNHFTEPYTNYYETSHYRPVVGDSILKLVYEKKVTKN